MDKAIDIDSMSDEEFQAFRENDEGADTVESAGAGDTGDTIDTGDGDDTVGSGDSVDGDKPDDKGVNHGRFHREREMRKRAEQDLNAAREREALWERRLNAMAQEMQGRQQTQQQEQQKSLKQSYDELMEQGDLIGANNLLLQQITTWQEREQQQTQQVEAQTRERQIIQNVRSEVGQRLQRATEDGEPAKEAFTFLMQQGIQTYLAQGYDEQQAQNLAINDADQSFLKVLRARKDPIEIMMNVAKAKGFKPGAGGTQQQDIDTSAIDDIERMNGVKNSAKSLGRGGSEARQTKMSTMDIINMSDAQIDQLHKKHGTTTFEQLFARLT